MATAQLPAGSKGLTVELVARLCGVNVAFTTGDVAVPTITTPEGDSLTGTNVVCEYLVQASGRTQLLGADPLEEAQISEWLTWANTELTPLVDDKLAKVNDWLQTRTYLLANRLTLADLVVFGTVYPAAAAFPVAQHMHFCNLLRWCDLLQHTAGGGLVPELKFNRPKFSPPAPVVPPAKAPAAAAAAAAPAAASTSKAAEPAAEVKTGKAATDAGASKAAANKENAAPAPAATAAAANGAPAAAGKEKGGKEGAKEDDGVGIDNLDMRVGVIVKVGKHPNADSLYLEEIDVGEAAPRQIVSGLVKWVPEAEMLNRRVVVVCNLKPAKMRDILSSGMVLCASDNPGGESTVVVPISPPEGVPVGERIKVQGYDREPLAEINNSKKKTLDKLFPDMQTDSNGTACYKGVPFMTSQGPVTSGVPNGMVK